MKDLLKLLKALKAKGFATVSEKAQVQTLLKELEADEAEVVADDVAEVEALADTDPADEAEVEEAVEKAFNKVGSNIEKGLSKKLADGLSSIKSEIETYVKAQKEQIENGVGIGEANIKAKHAKFNQYLKDFSNAIISGDDAKAKEMSTDKTGSPFAGYAVDSELSVEIRHLTNVYGVARREFFTTPLSKNSYEANALATDVTVAWVSEGGVIPSTQIVLSQEELKLKKLGAIVSLTRELIEDSEIDLFSFIATRVAEGFALAEDRAFFTGEGTGDTANAEYTGLLNNTDIPEVVVDGDSIADLTLEKIYEMIDTLPSGAQANAKFYGNRTIKSKVRLLKDGDGRYIYQDPINSATFSTLAGRPWVDVEVMPKASEVEAEESFLIYGDLKKTAILGFRNGLVADRFNAGTIRNVAGNADINLITTDREAIRWVTRVGYITMLPTASVRLSLGEASE
jgi:HK97 family phage major capsid protein